MLDGAPVTPGSGDPPRFEGVADQDPATYDVHYWHPDGAPDGQADDNFRRRHGYPVVRGLLDASARPFTPVGLSMRGFTAYGNHDGLVQGNFPRSFQLSAVAEGSLKAVSLPAGASFDDLERGDSAALQDAFTTAPARTVTPDPARKVISRQGWVQEHFTTGGTPMGHGLTSQKHTIETMTNRIVFVDDPQPRVLGDQVRDLLLSFPNVVMFVNGHTHRNKVTPYTRPDGGGFWQVNTAAHTDFPCQSRLLEVVDNADGTLSIFGTMLDAAAPLSYGGRLDTTTALAALAHELSVNDPQSGKGDDSRGSVEDRNVELLVKAPFALRPAAAPPAP